GQVTQNKPTGIVAAAAQTKQIRIQTLRQIEFAAKRVIVRLPIGILKELQGRTQLLPQFSGASIGLARFRRCEAPDGQQDRAQRTAKLKLLSLTYGVVRQQHQLVQSLLELRRNLRHCRTCDGPPTRIAPKGDGFFNETGLGVVLRKQLG